MAEPKDQTVPARESAIKPEHVDHLHGFLDAIERVYNEILGQAAHERLQKAREALHKAYTDGAEAISALKDELLAIKAAAAEPKDPGTGPSGVPTVQ